MAVKKKKKKKKKKTSPCKAFDPKTVDHFANCFNRMPVGRGPVMARLKNIISLDVLGWTFLYLFLGVGPLGFSCDFRLLLYSSCVV